MSPAVPQLSQSLNMIGSESLDSNSIMQSSTSYLKLEIPHFRREIPYLKLEILHSKQEIPYLKLEILHSRQKILYLKLEILHFRQEIPYLKLEILHFRQEIPYLKLEILYFRQEILYIKQEIPYFKLGSQQLRCHILQNNTSDTMKIPVRYCTINLKGTWRFPSLSD